MTNDQEILRIAQTIERQLDSLIVALKDPSSVNERKWFTPTELLAKAGMILARTSSDPTLQAGGVILYGCLHVLGIKGTMQLILNVRRKYVSNKTKRSQTPVPGVRTRSGVKD
jgi:hypothetical protein